MRFFFFLDNDKLSRYQKIFLIYQFIRKFKNFLFRLILAFIIIENPAFLVLLDRFFLTSIVLISMII